MDADAEPEPEPGAIRFAKDGTLEVYDGTSWSKYQPPLDPHNPIVFRTKDPQQESTREL
jgi:hypothetical protein